MLSPDAKARVEAHFRALPAGLKLATATEEQLRAFERQFGPIPEDYRWLLLTCGGGVIGSEHLDDVKDLPRSHAKFQREAGAAGWQMKDVFIIGWDGFGNPFGIELTTNRVLVEDHNFGGIHELNSSFADFLVKRCWI